MISDDFHVFIGGQEVQGVLKAELIMSHYFDPETYAPAFSTLMSGLQETTLVFDNIGQAFRDLFLNLFPKTRPPYKRNKHRYGK